MGFVKLLEVSEMSNAARGPSENASYNCNATASGTRIRCESMPCAKIAIDHILYSIFKDNHEIASCTERTRLPAND